MTLQFKSMSFDNTTPSSVSKGAALQVGGCGGERICGGCSNNGNHGRKAGKGGELHVEDD